MKKTILKKLMSALLAIVMVAILSPSSVRVVHADQYPFSAVKLADGTELTDITATFCKNPKKPVNMRVPGRAKG
ncbi:MAG: hypothetical protein K6E83_08645 [Clostridium sp.]|nr:hypothetical protein [Clostridium sp.]